MIEVIGAFGLAAIVGWWIAKQSAMASYLVTFFSGVLLLAVAQADGHKLWIALAVGLGAGFSGLLAGPHSPVRRRPQG